LRTFERDYNQKKAGRHKERSGNRECVRIARRWVGDANSCLAKRWTYENMGRRGKRETSGYGEKFVPSIVGGRPAEWTLTPYATKDRGRKSWEHQKSRTPGTQGRNSRKKQSWLGRATKTSRGENECSRMPGLDPAASSARRERF